MATPATLTKKQQRRTLNAKNTKSRTKNILCTPFKETRKKVDKKTQTRVQDKLVETLKTFHSQGAKASALKKYLKIGVNETTRNLERDLLSLVITDACAGLPTKHLRQLCDVRQCSYVVLHSLEISCSKLVGVTRLACVGFTKECVGKMKEFVDFACQHAPPADLPWLQFEQVMKEQVLDSDVPDQEQETCMDESQKESSDSNVESANGAPDLKPTVKDYSYLYTLKTQFKEPDKEKKEFGSSFIGFGSDSESDTDEVVSVSKRIKLVPKSQRKQSDKLWPVDHGVSSANPHKERRRKTTKEQSLGEEKSREPNYQVPQFAYKVANVGKMKPSDKKKKKKKKGKG